MGLIRAFWKNPKFLTCATRGGYVSEQVVQSFSKLNILHMSVPSPFRTRTRTLVGVSTLSALASATGATAGIVFNTTSVTSNNTDAGSVFWDIDGDGTDEAFLRNYQDPLFHKDLKNNANGFLVFGYPKLALVSENFYVGGSNSDNNGHINSIFRNGALLNVNQIFSGTPTFIGFAFNPTGTYYYGWAQVTLTTGSEFGTFTINQWAYENTGAGILAGQTSAVPEPSAYAFGVGALALGAAGLRRRRRTRAVSV
jgi:MYXO-CTERM domain-containing protein